MHVVLIDCRASLPEIIIALCDNAKCWFATWAPSPGAAPEDSGPDLDPECLFDLIDLPEAGTVDWDALGFGCREPFYKSTLKARLKKTKKSTKQVARAA